MKIIHESPEALAEAVTVLEAGGVVIHATETCYGITCDLTNPKALERLFAVKQRPLDQPVSALFSSLEEAQKYVIFSDKALSLAEKYLPGPLTLVLPPEKNPPFPISVCPQPLFTLHSSFLISSIGVRLSSHPFAQALALAFGKPIATTSANLHGKPNPYAVSEIEAQWAQSSQLPDLVIDSGLLPIAPPSTVIEVISDSIRVLRQGDVIVDPPNMR